MNPELTIVLPAYREESTIEICLRRLVSSLDDLGISFIARVVVDGPGDRTAEIVREFPDTRISVIELDQNVGKGFAIRKGFENCNSEYIGFIDADLDLHPDGLATALQTLKEADQNICGAIGSKVHPQSHVEYPLSRRFISSVYKRLVKIGFSLDLSDTQTGLKVFRTRHINQVLGTLKCNGFEFDLELLCRLARTGSTFLEIPVKLDYKFKSTVNIRTGFRALISTFWLAIYLRRN
jgi:glycosyltransferase involved in cell wall biosynthesis